MFEISDPIILFTIALGVVAFAAQFIRWLRARRAPQRSDSEGEPRDELTTGEETVLEVLSNRIAAFLEAVLRLR
jgi:hypothetical protein